MRDWYNNDCSCSSDPGPIIGMIIGGKAYKSGNVTQEQHEKDIAALEASIRKVSSECDSRYGLLDERVRILEKAGPNIVIASFKSSPQTALAGSAVAVKLEWETNVEPRLTTINGMNVAGYSYTAVGVNSTRTFTLEVTDKSGNVDAATTRIDFVNNIIYGGSNDEVPTSNTLNLLSTKVLSDEVSRVINIDTGSGAYAYFAYPKRLGKVKFITHGMFEGGFEDPEIVAYSNAAGFNEEYYAYRSSYKITGVTEIQVVKA